MLKILLVRMLFPRISRIVLTVDVKNESGDVDVNAQYPGSVFDPLTQAQGLDAEAAKNELLAGVKSAKYLSPASGKNELHIVI